MAAYLTLLAAGLLAAIDPFWNGGRLVNGLLFVACVVLLVPRDLASLWLLVVWVPAWATGRLRAVAVPRRWFVAANLAIVAAVGCVFVFPLSSSHLSDGAIGLALKGLLVSWVTCGALFRVGAAQREVRLPAVPLPVGDPAA